MRALPLALAMLIVAGIAAAAPGLVSTTQTSATFSGFDCGARYQAAFRKYLPGGGRGSPVKVDFTQQPCDPAPEPPAPPPGECDRTLTSGSLSSFVASLQAGETGCLHTGSYSAGSVRIDRANVTLMTVPGEERATITVSNIDLYGTGDRLDFLRIAGTTTSNSVGMRGADQVVEDSEVTNGHATASCFMVQASRPIIRRNVIHGCGSPAEDNKNHGIYVAAASGGQIVDNVFYDIQAYGLQLYPSPSNVLVAHNTFDSQPTIRGGIVAYGSGNTVERNIVATSPCADDPDETCGAIVDEGSNTIRDNCVTSNPMFVNRAARDYRLQPGSPCAGAGVR